MIYWMLDAERRPVSTANYWEWCRYMQSADTTVGQNTFGDVTVSTVFLGADYEHPSQIARLFETSVQGGIHDGAGQHCSTWEDAVKMHADVCRLVQSSPS